MNVVIHEFGNLWVVCGEAVCEGGLEFGCSEEYVSILEFEVASVPIEQWLYIFSGEETSACNLGCRGAAGLEMYVKEERELFDNAAVGGTDGGIVDDVVERAKFAGELMALVESFLPRTGEEFADGWDHGVKNCRVVLSAVVVFKVFEVSAECLFGELLERFDALRFVDVEELLWSRLVAIERKRGEEAIGRNGRGWAIGV